MSLRAAKFVKRGHYEGSGVVFWEFRGNGQILLMLISTKCYTLIWGVLRWIIRTCVLFNRVTAAVMDAIIIYFSFFYTRNFYNGPPGTYDRLRQYRRKVGDLVFLTRRRHVSNFSWCA